MTNLQAFSNSGLQAFIASGLQARKDDEPAGCPCANPGNGGTVTMTVTGHMFCLGSGVSTWGYAGADTCQWITTAIGGGIIVNYDAGTNQWYVFCVGAFVFGGFKIFVPATCSAGGVYPIFSASGSLGVCSWTITSV